MSPKQLLLILFAHRYVAAAMFVLVLVAGAAVTIFTPKTYLATTDLLVDLRSDPIAGTINIGQPNYIATQIAIIQSERLAIGVVKRLRIEETPALVDQWKLATKGKTPLENYYAALLRKGLLAEPLRSSNIIRLTYEGVDPKFVAAVVNTYAQAYVDLTIDLRVEPARQYAAWFDDRLKTLRDNMEAAQSKLSEYQRINGIVGSDQRADQETQRLDALMAQLVSIQGENMAIGSRQKMSGGELSPDIQASGAVQSIKAELAKLEAKLSELKVSLGPNHPQRIQLEDQIAVVKQQLTQEMSRVAGSANMAKTAGSLREAELRSVIAAQKNRVLALKAERDQVAVLSQDVEASKRIYDAVLQRSNQVNLEKQSDQANISILSPAVEPANPDRPNRPKYIATSVLAAIAAAFAAALGLELLNPKVRVVEDIMVDDVPVLGVIDAHPGGDYTWSERVDLTRKFFTKRKERKEFAAASRLAGL
jgi:polysaccharide biosynthesis transport protein